MSLFGFVIDGQWCGKWEELVPLLQRIRSRVHVVLDKPELAILLARVMPHSLIFYRQTGDDNGHINHDGAAYARMLDAKLEKLPNLGVVAWNEPTEQLALLLTRTLDAAHEAARLERPVLMANWGVGWPPEDVYEPILRPLIEEAISNEFAYLCGHDYFGPDMDTPGTVPWHVGRAQLWLEFAPELREYSHKVIVGEFGRDAVLGVRPGQGWRTAGDEAWFMAQSEKAYEVYRELDVGGVCFFIYQDYGKQWWNYSVYGCERLFDWMASLAETPAPEPPPLPPPPPAPAPEPPSPDQERIKALEATVQDLVQDVARLERQLDALWQGWSEVVTAADAVLRRNKVAR